MHKIENKIKQFYIDEPSMVDLRVFRSMEVLEDYLKKNDIMELAKPIFQEWEHIWELAKSYWVFPDDVDMKKLVDKHYKEKQL